MGILEIIVRNTRKIAALGAVCGGVLAACSGDHGSTAGSGTPVTPADPATLALKAENVLPPGQSGFVSAQGQAAGSASGTPSDYGAHLDDQREMYWSFDAQPVTLGSKPGTAAAPKSGVEIYRDELGVPIVYAPNVRDLWFGVGYAVAQDRLFLMDAVRRMGQGNFAALAGCGYIPADIQQRTLAYSAAEYQGFYNALSPDAKDAVDGYVDGANAWLAEVATDPNKLPAEYGLLSTTPEAFTVQDVLSAGVFITRYVAAEGGNEFLNIRMLNSLKDEYGDAAKAKTAFQDMVWLEDPDAVTSVRPQDGRFSNQAAPSGFRTRADVFNTMADWAMALPETIWKGDGTGNASTPEGCGQPALPGPLGSAGGLGAGEVSFPLPPGKHQAKRRAYAQKSVRGQSAAAAVRKAVLALQRLRANFHGGSMAYAIGPARTRDHGTLLVSGPQLGYSYPSLLVEYEIHSGAYNARGVSVPILPVVGIGYNADIAWGLTTGYSKTIDSFIETICSSAQQGAGTCTADQYFHQGAWKDMSCRTETFNYRATDPGGNGAPVGPANLSQDAKICRTVHGPVVARDAASGLARSVQYAMWQHEIDTIEGVRQWNRAKGFADFLAGAQKVTWNENVTFATRDGHFGYIHPGLFPRRSPDTDMRLPSPGDGRYDFGANLSFAELPKSIDPAAGFVANWNTKPAQGWLDGEGMGSTSRPGGPGQRVTSILDFIATRSDWTFADLRDIDRHHGTTDHRAREYLPLLQAFRTSAAASLSAVQSGVLDLMLTWDRAHYGPDIDINDAAATDGPAATVFAYYIVALRQQLFGDLQDNVLDSVFPKPDPTPDPNNPAFPTGLTIYSRLSGVGSHAFDQSVMDNLIVRILNPAGTRLPVQHDFTGGRSRDEVMLAALNAALDRLATDFNSSAALTTADLPKCRRIHPRSAVDNLTGVIGPSTTMPYQDRGSWVHRVGFEAAP